MNTFFLTCYHIEKLVRAVKRNFFACSQVNQKINKGAKHNKFNASEEISDVETETTFDNRSESVYVKPRSRSSKYTRTPNQPSPGSTSARRPPPEYSNLSGNPGTAPPPKANHRYDHPQPQPRVYPDVE